MKNHKAFIVAITVVAASTGLAQYSVEPPAPAAAQRHVASHGRNFERIQRNYLLCLNSENVGVVESALGHVTYMRIAYPKLDLTVIQEKLLDLSMNGYSRPIRRKAFMALKVFANPSLYASAISAEQYSGDGLFEDIAGRRNP